MYVGTRVDTGGYKCLGALQIVATPSQVLCKCLVSPLSPVCAYISEQRMYMTLARLIGLISCLHCLQTTCTALAQGLQIP